MLYTFVDKGPACSPVGLQYKASSPSHILPRQWLRAAGLHPANDHAMPLSSGCSKPRNAGHLRCLTAKFADDPMWHPCRRYCTWVVSTTILLRHYHLHLIEHTSLSFNMRSFYAITTNRSRSTSRLHCTTSRETKVRNTWNSWRDNVVTEPKYHTTNGVVREDTTCIECRKWTSAKS